MYRKHHNGQLSIEDFHVPFGGTLDPDNRWVIFSSLMPWEELEETYAPQFNPTTGAPAKPVRLAFGALFIKQRLGLTDEETVEQIRENAYMQFFLGFVKRHRKLSHFRHRKLSHPGAGLGPRSRSCSALAALAVSLLSHCFRGWLRWLSSVVDAGGAVPPQTSLAGVGGGRPPMPDEEEPPACGRNRPALRFSLSR